MISSILNNNLLRMGICLAFCIALLAGCAPRQAEKNADLQAAAQRHNVNAIQSALSLGADVNATNTDGETPLILASKFHPDSEIRDIELLILAGANVNLQDKNGISPLMYSALSKHEIMASALLKAGASKSLVSKDGRTAADFAMLDQKPERQEEAKRFIEIIDSY